MVHGCYTHEKDQAQYALCDWRVFKGRNQHRFSSLAADRESFKPFLIQLCEVKLFRGQDNQAAKDWQRTHPT